MKNVLLLAMVLVVLCGCGSARATRSPLQTLDGMRQPLSLSTQDARIVANDFGLLQQNLRRQNAGGVRRVAVLLRRDAKRLCRQTGQNGYTLRRLLRLRGHPAANQYMRMTMRVMVMQWAEGAVLKRMAGLVWHDPYLWLRNDSSRLYWWQLNARWYAWRAALSAVAANRFLQAHGRAFRYVRISSRH
ncbi:MAG: hypothetical protein NVS2B16_06430 [Chloroflexota bacterium]